MACRMEVPRAGPGIRAGRGTGNGLGRPGPLRSRPATGRPRHGLRLRGRSSPALFQALSKDASRPGAPLRLSRPFPRGGQRGRRRYRSQGTQRRAGLEPGSPAAGSGSGAAAPPRAVHCGCRTDLCGAAERAGSGGRRWRAGPGVAGPRRRSRLSGGAALLPPPEAVAAPPGGRHQPPGLSRPRAGHHGRGGGGRSRARPEGTVPARLSRRSVGAGARPSSPGPPRPRSLRRGCAGPGPAAPLGPPAGSERGEQRGPARCSPSGESPAFSARSFVRRALRREAQRRDRAGAHGAAGPFFARSRVRSIVCGTGAEKTTGLAPCSPSKATPAPCSWDYKCLN
ncbi:collagen alpha-1(I) chain-like [Ammospiza caudacuta]|uniref:collagen alpha-1(I) chain-like n=1 Tax=Ammospiza caudacuta TaxID=2857398 RepID=UPI0027399665|nr:collagen alpha-1(I) chain-like [Ammospiza caudacuta]